MNRLMRPYVRRVKMLYMYICSVHQTIIPLFSFSFAGRLLSKFMACTAKAGCEASSSSSCPGGLEPPCGLELETQYTMSELPGLSTEELEEQELQSGKRQRLDDHMAEFRARKDTTTFKYNAFDAAQPLAVGGRGVIRKHACIPEFDNCRLVVERLLVGTIFSFTIGVTVDPEHRFNNKGYGYRSTLGAFALVILCRTSRYDACELERQLIRHFSSNPRCRNRASGGEGLAIGASSVYVYLCVGGFSSSDFWELPKKSVSR